MIYDAENLEIIRINNISNVEEFIWTMDNMMRFQNLKYTLPNIRIFDGDKYFFLRIQIDIFLKLKKQ